MKTEYPIIPDGQWEIDDSLRIRRARIRSRRRTAVIVLLMAVAAFLGSTLIANHALHGFLAGISLGAFVLSFHMAGVAGEEEDHVQVFGLDAESAFTKNFARQTDEAKARQLEILCAKHGRDFLRNVVGIDDSRN